MLLIVGFCCLFHCTKHVLSGRELEATVITQFIFTCNNAFSVLCPMRFLYSVLILRSCENTLSLSALLCGRQRSTLNNFFIRGNLGTLRDGFMLSSVPQKASVESLSCCRLGSCSSVISWKQRLLTYRTRRRLVIKDAAQYTYESEHLRDRIACFPYHKRKDPTLSQICIFP